MPFFGRMFGERPASATTRANRRSRKPDDAPDAPEEIPVERIGPDGKFDQSGLAKRVALAFDDDSKLDDVETLWVAQTGTKVVLKGSVPSKAVLDKMVAVAKATDGATEVDTEQVTVG